MSTAKERRAFYERSLADLDAEHDAGDLSDDDHARLRADYERRLAGLSSPRPTAPARGGSPGGRVAATAFVVVVAIGAGVLLAGAVGRRDANDNITGADLDAAADETTVPAGPTTTIPEALAACGADGMEAGDAFDCFIAYTRAHPDDPQGFFLFGIFSLNIGLQADRQELIDGGEQFLRQAIELDPGYAEARVNLATVLARSDRVDEAREVLAPLEGVELPPALQQLVDVLTPLLTTTTTAAP